MHFITKKHLSRRTVLRGMGVSIALPLLDAMIPARTAIDQETGELVWTAHVGDRGTTVAPPAADRGSAADSDATRGAAVAVGAGAGGSGPA